MIFLLLQSLSGLELGDQLPASVARRRRRCNLKIAQPGPEERLEDHPKGPERLGQLLPLRGGFRVQAARLMHTWSRHQAANSLDDGACHAVDNHVSKSRLNPLAFCILIDSGRLFCNCRPDRDNKQLGLGDAVP